jgi:CrcB protein
MDMTRVMLVGIGGFLGSIARYVTVRTVDARLNQLFPFGTLTVNVVGCFVIGIIAGIAGRQAGGGENLRAFLGAGFCGGFTTFSAFALENHNLLSERMAGTSLLYIGGSVVAGIAAVFGGLWCARFL